MQFQFSSDFMISLDQAVNVWNASGWMGRTAELERENVS